MNTPVNFAVHHANEFLRIAGQDGLIKQAGKASTKALTNAVLTVAAAVETVVFAVLTALATPLKYFERTRNTYESLAGRLQIAASAVKEAAMNIAGNMKVETPKVEAPKAPTVRENLQKAIDTVKNNPGKAATALLSGMALVFAANYARGYFVAPEAFSSVIASRSQHVYDLVQGAGKNVCSTLSSLLFDKSPVPAFFS